MTSLREQLQSTLHGRICFMGLGNVDGGDDGCGVRLAEALSVLGVPNVLVAGTDPERLISHCVAEGFSHLVFLDAVEFGAAPGSVVLLNAQEMGARFPQFSTHKISLWILANYVEAGGKTRAWLLGVQPASLKPATALSPAVRTTVVLLTEMLDSIVREVVGP